MRVLIEGVLSAQFHAETRVIVAEFNQVKVTVRLDELKRGMFAQDKEGKFVAEGFQGDSHCDEL